MSSLEYAVAAVPCYPPATQRPVCSCGSAPVPSAQVCWCTTTAASDMDPSQQQLQAERQQQRLHDGSDGLAHSYNFDDFPLGLPPPEDPLDKLLASFAESEGDAQNGAPFEFQTGATSSQER